MDGNAAHHAEVLELMEQAREALEHSDHDMRDEVLRAVERVLFPMRITAYPPEVPIRPVLPGR